MSELRPPDYGKDQMRDQVGRWMEAAEAFRRQDPAAVGDLLTNPDLPDAHAYSLLVAQTALGAYMCALSIAEAHGHTLDTLPPNREYVVDELRPDLEASAARRTAMSVIMQSLNGQEQEAVEAVVAYSAPPNRKGVERLCDLTFELLMLYIGFDDLRRRNPPLGGTS